MTANGQPKAPRRQSKKDLANALLLRLDQWQKEGDTPEEAIEKLTLKQYDFLIDYGVNLDNLILTTEQQKAVTAITSAGRPKGLTYNKKYPQSKQDLFTAIETFIQSQGATIQPREKTNYRDLDFEISGIKYRIVLSNPRTPKN
jgi:hypothetical protein